MPGLTLSKRWKASRMTNNRKNGKTKENPRRKIPALRITKIPTNSLKWSAHTRKSAIHKIRKTRTRKKALQSFPKCNLSKKNNKNRRSQRYRLQLKSKRRNKTCQSREKSRNACVKMKRVLSSLKRKTRVKTSRSKRVTARTWSWTKNGRDLLSARATHWTTTVPNRYFRARCTTLWPRPSPKNAPPRPNSSNS